MKQRAAVEVNINLIKIIYIKLKFEERNK